VRRPTAGVAPHTEQAARWLLGAHRTRATFRPLPPELAPASAADAYSIQSAFVGLRAQSLGAVAGYKIALTTPAMRALVGLNDSIAGEMLAGTLRSGPARVRGADYGRLIVECEIAFQMADDLPAVGAPYTRDKVAAAVGTVMPAFELADDRNADYQQLPASALTLIADNAWNEGAVLGVPVKDWRGIDLDALEGVASINGQVVGKGYGRDVMGHPLEALAWIANHLAARGMGLWRSDIVITGSLVTSKFPQAGDTVRFDAGALGSVQLSVD
jgi:2-keto-4-pentenoate hydratase